MIEIETVQVDITFLRPADYNPRQMTKKQAEDLEDSVKKFGMVDPIIVNNHPDRRNVIIGGHQRYEIAKRLGLPTVPVVYVNLNEEDERELNLRLNKNLGEWNWEQLANFDKELLSKVGFGEEDLIKAGLELTDEDDGLQIEPPDQTDIKQGDMFQLGNHYLLCGDATEIKDYEKLLQGKKARLIFTDPPYSVDYRSSAGLSYDSKKYGGTGEKIFDDDKTPEQALEFYKKVLVNLHKFSTDDTCLYWWFANKIDWINHQAWQDTDWHRSQVIIWLKNSLIFSRGVDYHRCYEPCMYGWKKGNKHFTSKGIANARDVINLTTDDFESILDVWYEHRDTTQDYVHPMQRPIRLAERGIRKNTIEGDIVLDVFGGSGSTMMAAEQMKRKCYTMELDPKYCAAIIKRYEEFTNTKAVKL